MTEPIIEAAEEHVAPRDFSRSDALRLRAHRAIPGGAHTYAKGDDQYPASAPGFIDHCKGCYVWDVDGNRFIEYGQGVRSVTLGHGHPRVVAAAYEQMQRGTNFVRPAAIEVAAAEGLLRMVGGPEDMVKFGKNGSDTTSAAVRLARAVTGRDLVAIADQPFFSVDDWFIGSTEMNAGVPEAVRNLTLRFRYNDLDSLADIFARHPKGVAALVMEAVRNDEPAPGFLQGVQQLCRQHGTLFVLDEMITGFRWHDGGARAYFGLDPDLSTFGKAMANGFAVSALVGKRRWMEHGGLQHDGERVFLLSLTHGAETSGLAAAIATMEVYRQERVVAHIWSAGQRLSDGLTQLSRAHGLSEHVFPVGSPCNLVYATRDAEGKPSQPLRTLLLQELLTRGVLAPSLVVGLMHDDEVIDRTLDAFDGSMRTYRRALEDGVERYLVGRAVQPVLRRYNGVI